MASIFFVKLFKSVCFDSEMTLFWQNLLKAVCSSMIKRVLGQPNFSPQTNTTKLFPKLTQTLTTYHPLKLTQIYRLC